MTVEEAHIEKQEAENKISVILQDLQASTGLILQSVGTDLEYSFESNLPVHTNVRITLDFPPTVQIKNCDGSIIRVG